MLTLSRVSVLIILIIIFKYFADSIYRRSQKSKIRLNIENKTTIKINYINYHSYIEKQIPLIKENRNVLILTWKTNKPDGLWFSNTKQGMHF